MAASLAPDEEEDGAVLSVINTTPLVDVMLVLLIIFLVTIPVVTASIPVALPREKAAPAAAETTPIVLTVDSRGQVFWRDAPLPGGDALRARLAALAAQDPRPAIQVRGDARARFEAVADILAACRAAGIDRIGFVTDPSPGR